MVVLLPAAPPAPGFLTLAWVPAVPDALVAVFFLGLALGFVVAAAAAVVEPVGTPAAPNAGAGAGLGLLLLGAVGGAELAMVY